ncbi:Fe-S cluster assembly protein SufD [Luteimonas sp. BDR2-5]|uniref:Fe-S cluster assembly protein SufD n=1 Tax=Proluteimonas luteida TaxID=2878685 RepID=UPI001E64335D|nr:Fe-S cluster assembly protein SufD [Luteimonas sp. BDR2-5]MCD9028172.1 Fe-S cluster assembly protein SufD [Luteimonas sp. BDR2-5]
MSALLESLAAGFDGDAARRAALDAALQGGLPGPRSEAWKYTSLRALERRTFAPAEADARVDAALLAGIPAPRVVFVNGRVDAALTDLADLPGGVHVRLRDGDECDVRVETGARAGDAVFRNLNAALANAGVVVHASAAAATDAALHLVFVGAPAATDLAWHLRHDVLVDAGASLSLVEHHIDSGAHRHLDTGTTTLRIAEGARMRHLRLQHRTAGATTFLQTDGELRADADYTRVDVELGGGLTRHELDVRLVGDRARLTANGVLLAGGRAHVETRLGIRHVARDTACQLMWRGIGERRGRVVFHGGITIDAGADGTDARLSNKNLLLSDTAEIDTQPVLVIHADEVQAAHGATVGQIDANALFYLRSRGLPAAEARHLLTAAFVREPLAPIEDDALRGQVQAHLDRALAGGDAP